MKQLTGDDVALWRDRVDKFGGTELDAAVNVILLDDFFTNEQFRRDEFTAAVERQAGKKPAAEKPVEPAAKQEKDKGIVTAWGEEVGGLQAGLSVSPGGKRAYHHGETITLAVRVRNVGKEAANFEYVRQFLDEQRPTVTDADGKAVPQEGTTMLGFHLPEKVTVEPGKEVELETRMFGASGIPCEFRPTGDRAKPPVNPVKAWPLVVGAGKVSVHYDRVIGNSSSGFLNNPDPNLSKLATGKLELEIKSGPPAVGKGEPLRRADRERLQGTWQAVEVAVRGGELGKVTGDQAKELTLAFDGDRLTWRGFKLTYTLDPGKTPKQLDWSPAEGEKRDGVRAIYKLDGDTLTMAWGNPKDDRPTEFKSLPGPGSPEGKVRVVVFKRTKP